MRTRLLATAIGLVVAACSPGDHGGLVQPLVDLRHAPDTLFESRELAQPPSTTGNRYLQGWWPRSTERGFRLLPNPLGVSLEVTQIEARRRTLTLALEFDAAAAGRPVRVRVGDDPPVEIGLAEKLEIALAEDLRPGRVPVHLVFPTEANVLLETAGLDLAAEAGRIDLGRDRIRQSGTSLLDIPRYLPAGARLTGRFVPPERPSADQSFTVLAERDEGPAEELFAWSAADGAEPSSFDRRLGAAGPCRIRLLARGVGPPAAWEELRLVSPTIEAVAADAAEVGEGTDAEPAEPPRLVVFYVLDALRADGLGAYGAGAEVSPTIDRLADEGVVFRDHQSVSPNTLPSTKALFSGRTPIKQGNAKLAAGGATTVAEDLTAAGYRTAIFSGNGYVSHLYGTARGFDFVDESVVFEEYPAGGGRYNDNAKRVHAAALDWLGGLGADEAAFIYLHTIHPHNPYDPPPDLTPPLDGRSTIDGSSRTLLDVKHVKRPTTEADRERLAELYRGSITFNDRELERLLEALLERFDRSELLVIITSDHGEELFDHRGVLHGYTLYEEQLDIPLIVWSPDHLRPGSVTRPTTNVELGAALRRFAAPPAEDGSTEATFFDWVGAAPTDGPEPAIRFAAAASVKGGIFMARSERYKVIWAPRHGTRWGMGEGTGRSRSVEYVFDLESDPGEQNNLAGSPNLEVAWLRSRLMAWVATESAAEELGEEPSIDAETEARLRALGYLD